MVLWWWQLNSHRFTPPEVNHSIPDTTAGDMLFLCWRAGVEMNYSWVKCEGFTISLLLFQHEWRRGCFSYIRVQCCGHCYEPHFQLGETMLSLLRKYIYILFLAFSTLCYYTRKTNWSLQMADKAIGHKAQPLCFHTTRYHFPPKVPSARARDKTQDIIWGHTSWQTAAFVILSGLPRRKHQEPVVRFPQWKAASVPFAMKNNMQPMNSQPFHLLKTMRCVSFRVLKLSCAGKTHFFRPAQKSTSPCFPQHKASGIFLMHYRIIAEKTSSVANTA